MTFTEFNVFWYDITTKNNKVLYLYNEKFIYIANGRVQDHIFENNMIVNNYLSRHLSLDIKELV